MNNFIKKVAENVTGLLPETEVETKEVKKNNNVTLNGIIIKKPGESVSPAFYVESYLENGLTDAREIAVKITEEYRKHEKQQSVLQNVGKMIDDFSQIKPYLRIRLVSRKLNEDALKNMPFIPFLDMAIIPVAAIPVKDGTGSVKINDSLLRKWGHSLEELLPVMNENTFRTPYKLVNMKQMLGDMVGDCSFGLPPEMYVLTNEENSFGATQICNPATMQEIADRLDSNLLVIPSSVHEVLIVPVKPDEEKEMTSQLTSIIREVNETQVSPEETLSDHPYIFTKDKGWKY